MKAFTPVILIIVAFGLFFFQVTGLYADVKQLRAESAEYDVAIEKARELETVRAQLAKTLESFSPTDLERLDHFLPKNLDTVRIILDVDGIADKNGVRLNGLKVGEPVVAQKAAPKGAAATAGNVGSGKVTHSAVDVTFNFTATYPKGVSFIQDLQRSLRLLDVVSLKINPSQEASGTYNFDVKLQTYWLSR
jgi:Tfp pilus assembly protein PilO